MYKFCCDELRKAIDEGVINTIPNDYGKHTFWSNNPIPQYGETMEECQERSTTRSINGFESVFLTTCPYCNHTL